MARRGRRRLAVAAGVAAACAGVLAPSARAEPDTVTALGVGADQNSLFQFDIRSPTSPLAPIPVNGLTAGDTLVGIDFRPLDGALYAVAVNATTVRTYTIVPTTGVATLVGAATVNTIAGATAYGMSFDPVVDRIRLSSNLASDGPGGIANNLRLRPDTGALVGQPPAVDTDLDASGLPGGNANAPAVALAHDRTPGSAATTAFAIVSGGDRLVRLGGVDGSPSPDLGALANVGALGVDASENAGLDIDGRAGVGYAVLEVAGVTRVFSVNLTTGEATPTALDNRVGTGTRDFTALAIPSRPVLALSAAAYSASEGDAAGITVTRTGVLSQSATVRYATRSTATSTASGTDYVPTGGTLIFPPGVASQSFAIPTVEDTAFEANETIDLELSDPSDADLAEDPLDATLTIANDDAAPVPPPTPPPPTPPPPPPPPFGTGIPPLGLIAVPTQPIDRSLAGTFACTQACRATLVLRVGRTALRTRRVTLANPGRRGVAFALTPRQVALLRRLSAGPRTVLLSVTGSFADDDGTTSTAFQLRLG